MVRRSLVCSTRPLLVAGHGIRLAKAFSELEAVLKMGLPVVTTFNGFDLVPSDHPNFVGRIGTVGTPGGNYALSQCNFLICVGTRNNFRQIGFEPNALAPKAKKAVVDIDWLELVKPTVNVYDRIDWDAKRFLAEFPNRIRLQNEPGWLERLRFYNITHPIELTSPYKFIFDLTSKLESNAVVVCGNGTACVCMFQAGVVKKGQRYIWNSGCAAMGYDLPAAIGAYYSCKHEVICVTGDGSIQMNLQELQTIKHYKMPIKIFVLNNNGYHSIRQTQTNYFGGDFIGCDSQSGVSFPELEKVAYAFGIYYTKSMEEALSRKEAVICEVDTGSDYVFQKFPKLEVK